YRLTTVANAMPDGSRWGTTYMAFEDDLIVAPALQWDWATSFTRETSSAKGLSVFRITDGKPYLKQLTFYRCAPGEWGDVSIWKRFVFMSVAGHNSYRSETCNNTDKSRDAQGIRIVDISDPSHPRQVKFVRTQCGSLGHTLFPRHGKIYIYDGTGGQCRVFRNPTGRMDIIEFDPRHPRRAHIASAPTLHISQLQGCYETLVIEHRNLFACSYLYHAALYDTTDPLNPVYVGSAKTPTSFSANNLSATWDGNILVMSDAGDGGQPAQSCSAGAPVPDFYFFDIEDVTNPVLVGTYSLERIVMPADDRILRNCNSWSATVLPTKKPGRRVMSVGYAAGGFSLIDFSNPAEAKEIAYWFEGDGPASYSDVSGVYWYQGRIYAGEWQSRTGIHVFDVDGFNRATTHYFEKRFNPGTMLIHDLQW
ncbi:MAG: hypothetical protein M3161_07440, partial [Actinomycetota bacterium]|nr:hypothetical protein [Actinomycetota bacterium]